MQTQVAEKKRTRAEALRARIKIRLASNEAGQEIARILAANGVVLPDADWSAVFPHWLIATDGNEVIGCCQVLHGKPVGFVEFLYAKPSASYKLRVIGIRKLMISAMATLHAAKTRYIGGFVDQKNRKLAEVLSKHSFTRIAVGDIVVKVLV